MRMMRAAVAAAMLCGGAAAWGQARVGIQNGGVVAGPGVVVPGGPAVGTNLTVSTLSTGTVLDVTGAVSADARHVTLHLNPAFSTFNGMDVFRGGPVGVGLPGGQGVNVAAGRAAAAAAAAVPGVVFVELDKTLLGAQLPAVSAEKVSLREGVRKLAVLSKTNIVLGSRALAEAGIDDQSPRSWELPAGTLKEALTKVLRAAAPDKALVVTAEDKVVFVTTQAQGDTMVAQKTYYLEDLVKNSPLWLKAGTDLAGAERAVAGGGTGKGAAVRGSTNIMEMVTQNVRPEIWKVNGGKIGEIVQVGDKVMITAPQSVHAMLDGPSHVNPNQAPLYVDYSTK